jgi:hypothetical protein
LPGGVIESKLMSADLDIGKRAQHRDLNVA